MWNIKIIPKHIQWNHISSFLLQVEPIHPWDANKDEKPSAFLMTLKYSIAKNTRLNDATHIDFWNYLCVFCIISSSVRV